MKQEIENIKREKEKTLIQLEANKLEINEIKAIIERHEITKIPGLKEIEDTIQKESLDLFGDPKQVQRRLLDVTNHIEALKAKIQMLN